jgi:hypothetical protein
MYDLPPYSTAAAKQFNLKLPCRVHKSAVAEEMHLGRRRRRVHCASLMHPTSLSHWFYLPLHVSPGRLPAEARRTQQQTKRPATFSGKLQAAKVTDVELIPRRPHRADAGAAQGLVQRP